MEPGDVWGFIFEDGEEIPVTSVHQVKQKNVQLER